MKVTFRLKTTEVLTDVRLKNRSAPSARAAHQSSLLMFHRSCEGGAGESHYLAPHLRQFWWCLNPDSKGQASSVTDIPCVSAVSGLSIESHLSYIWSRWSQLAPGVKTSRDHLSSSHRQAPCLMSAHDPDVIFPNIQMKNKCWSFSSIQASGCYFLHKKLLFLAKHSTTCRSQILLVHDVIKIETLFIAADLTT